MIAKPLFDLLEIQDAGFLPQQMQFLFWFSVSCCRSSRQSSVFRRNLINVWTTLPVLNLHNFIKHRFFRHHNMYFFTEALASHYHWVVFSCYSNAYVDSRDSEWAAEMQHLAVGLPVVEPVETISSQAVEAYAHICSWNQENLWKVSYSFSSQGPLYWGHHCYITAWVFPSMCFVLGKLYESLPVVCNLFW